MRTKISLLIVAVTLLFGCQQYKIVHNQIGKKGMIKVTILYPNGDGKTFDMGYYTNKHIPLVKRLFGEAMKGAAIDKGVAGGTTGAPVPYLAIGYLYFESIPIFQEGMKIHARTILADIPNYTNSTPVVQISELIQ